MTRQHGTAEGWSAGVTPAGWSEAGAGGGENTASSGLSFRGAQRGDTAKILEFIRALAKYEKMENEVVATEELLLEELFVNKRAEVVFAVVQGREVGFILFFHNFSTFLGRSGIFLEDLFVLEEYRGLGIGKALLEYLARVALERGCGRLEWSCLDWNKPSIGFYLAMGAEAMAEWTVYRVSGGKLQELAQQGQTPKGNHDVQAI